MTTRRIPTIFPSISLQEVNARMLAKSSLMRKIAHAQNFLWAHGQVYLGTGNEGNGYKITNRDDPKEFETVPTTPPTEGGLCVCTFYLPQNWSKLNQLKVSFQTAMSALGAGHVYVILEDLKGAFISIATYTLSTGVNSGSLTINTPVTGEYQVRVLIQYVDGGSLVSAAGTRSLQITHVSARYLNDTTGVEQTYFEYPADLLSNDYPIAAVFLNKLVKNLLHLWGTRPPEICQAYVGQNYWNTGTFTQVGRYVVWQPDKLQEVEGRLTVWCTSGGAGNEIRITDGTTTQTFTALSAGLNELDITAFGALQGAETTYTIEAKSTAASANWGTILLGVQLWESSFTLSSPADYEPLDEEGLDGDDAITAEDLNSFSQRTGIRKLMNNNMWLAVNRPRNLIGDWLHRTYKRGPLFSAPDDKNFDPRIDWTRGPNQQDYQPGRPRNITIMTDGGADFKTDSLGTFPYGMVDAQSGYNEAASYIFPYSFTFNGHGARLAHALIHQANGANVQVIARVRRAGPYLMANDGTGTGPLSADLLYEGKGYLLVDFDASEYTMPLFIGGAATAADTDRKPKWLSILNANQETTPYDFDVTGRLPPQSEGALPKDNIPSSRPEGTLFEVELNTLYVAEALLTEAELAAL